MLVTAVQDAALARAAGDATRAEVTRESFTPEITFGDGLRNTLAELLGGGVPVLPTGAGHDAGILSATVPTAMLFVRDPTGVSHSPTCPEPSPPPSPNCATDPGGLRAVGSEPQLPQRPRSPSPWSAPRSRPRCASAGGLAELGDPPHPRDVLRLTLTEMLPLHADARATSRTNAAYVLEALHDDEVRARTRDGMLQGRARVERLIRQAITDGPIGPTAAR